MMNRRRFFVLGTQLSGAVVAAFLGVPIVGWLLRPLFSPRPVVWRRVGRIGDIPVEQPVVMRVSFPPQPPPESWSDVPDTWIVFVVRYRDNSLKVFSNICTHMQCPVRWEPAIFQFVCPCHGGLYSIQGVNVGGPPPAPLPQWVHRIDPDGTLYVSNRLGKQLP